MSAVFTLNTPHRYPEDTVVTLDSNGNPKNYIYDDSWNFSSSHEMATGKSSTVSFKAINSTYKAAIQQTLFEFIEREKKRKKVPPSIGSMETLKIGLSWVADSLGHTNWAELSDDTSWRRFKKRLKSIVKSKGVSERTVVGVLTGINQLHSGGYCVRDVTYDELEKVSAIQGAKQHIAIPIQMYISILQSALATVEKYHPYRHQINQVMEEAYRVALLTKKQLTTDGFSINIARQRVSRAIVRIPHSIPDFDVDLYGSAISRIQAACATITFAFSGIRLGELISLHKCSYGLKMGVPTIQGETSKGEDGRPKKVTWQTHHVVKDALELAHDITDHLRDLYKLKLGEMQTNGIDKSELDKHAKEIACTFVSISASRVKTRFIQNNLTVRIAQNYRESVVATAQDVDEFNRLNPTRRNTLVEGGYLPKLSAHDFRRSFAVFFKRYGFGSSNAIKFQYKHKNIQMSDYYANNARLQAMEDVLLDNDLMKLMQEEGIQLGVEIFDEIYNESEVLSGMEGKRIAQDKFARLEKGYDVYMTRKEIETLVRNGGISVVKLPNGIYCTNSECSRLCGLNEFAADKKPCAHKVVTDNGAKRILRQNKRLIATFRGMNNGDHFNHSMLVGIKQKIKLNELTLNEHKLNFEPFTDKVIGLIETERA